MALFLIWREILFDKRKVLGRVYAFDGCQKRHFFPGTFIGTRLKRSRIHHPHLCIIFARSPEVFISLQLASSV